ALTTVMDLYPTILELTGTAYPRDEFRGRAVAPMQGVSLVPLLRGEAEGAHSGDFAVGFEVNGHGSLHLRDWKIVYSRDFTDSRWQLFDMAARAGERVDLSTSNPERLAALLRLWQEFAARNGVITSGADASPQLPF